MSPRRCLVVLLVMLALGLFFTASAAAQGGTTYYVSPTGSDSNPGTEALPWRTIQKAANTLTAGDTVYIRGGTYGERVVPQNSGTEGNYITYAAYPGETAIIDGTGVTLPSWGGLFHVSGKNYIKISGLRVINAGPNLDNAGIMAEYASYIIVENNYTDNTKSSGIGVWHSNNVIVAGNEVVHANNGGYQENITIASTNAFEVRDNYVHDSFTCTNGGEGIDIKHSFNGKVYRNHLHHQYCVGIYIDAWDKHTHDIDVFQNIVHDVQGVAFALSSEMGALLENIRLYNNLAYANDYGVYITTWGPASTHPMRTIAVFNNTIANNGLGTWGGGVTVENPEVEAVTIANNIVSDNLSYQIVVHPDVPAAQVRVDYNLINGFRGLEDGETRGTNYVEADPRFVDPGAADYHLQATSPAINAGDNASLPADVTTDLDGNPRLSDGRVDMGAYEVQVGPQPPTANFTASPTAGVAPLTVTFTDLSSGGPTAWAWDFGDSGSSTSQNPTYQYTEPGYYAVSLTAFNDLGQDTETKANYITVRPAEAADVIFSDGFETGLDWTKSGDVTWYTGSPKNGTHSVRLRTTGSIQRTISTAGYRFISVSFSMGANSLDNSNENLQALWYDGANWVVLKQINDKDPAENNQLNPFEFQLPQAADNNPALALRFKLNGSATNDYGYIDDVVVRGYPLPGAPTATPTPTTAPTNTPTWTPTPPPTNTPTPTPTNTPTPTRTPTAAPTNTPTPAPTNTPTPTPSGALQRIFFDDFEASFSGWYKEGNTTWYTGDPKIGTHSVRMAGNNCWMQRTISTVGYQNIVYRVYLGAGSYEAYESLMAYWWDGATWQVLKTIRNGDPQENGQLHFMEFSLPAGAANRSDFKLAFGQWDAGSGDYGYIDNVEVLGVRQ